MREALNGCDVSRTKRSFGNTIGTTHVTSCELFFVTILLSSFWAAGIVFGCEKAELLIVRTEDHKSVIFILSINGDAIAQNLGNALPYFQEALAAAKGHGH